LGSLAWTGLALVQAYRLSGDAAALARARQLFDFSVSGWDNDPTHADPGGVWWSQQMPNPRFIHRNTVSTASSAELGLQLYEAGGRTERYYLDWATRMYTWVDAYLRGPNGLYDDHVDLAGVVDPCECRDKSRPGNAAMSG
jgi:predicted alpha-1,6-mannanase (GH76 family)